MDGRDSAEGLLGNAATAFYVPRLVSDQSMMHCLSIQKAVWLLGAILTSKRTDRADSKR
jgi:hypothetical protein